MTIAHKAMVICDESSFQVGFGMLVCEALRRLKGNGGPPPMCFRPPTASLSTFSPVSVTPPPDHHVPLWCRDPQRPSERITAARRWGIAVVDLGRAVSP